MRTGDEDSRSDSFYWSGKVESYPCHTPLGARKLRVSPANARNDLGTREWHALVKWDKPFEAETAAAG